MKTFKHRSQNQEKSVAKNMNAKTVVASGAVLEIHERMNKGEHYSVICAEFNIGQTQAYKIKRKENWVFNG